MSDISIPGLSSKYNTSKIVEDLVAAERIRLTRMEDRVAELETTRGTWRQVNRQLGDLQRASKDLFGFENPFSEKIAASSDERILTARATRAAPLDEFRLLVKRVATSDRFLSPSLSRDFRVDEGLYTFRVGDEEVSLKYRGGTLGDFVRRLNDKGEGLVRATTIRDTTDTQVLMIEAIPTGEANRLTFLDDAAAFGLRSGLLRPARVEAAEVSVDPSALETSGSVTGDGTTLVVGRTSTAVLPLPPGYTLNAGMVLEYEVRTVEYDPDSLVPPPPPGPEWPEVPAGTFADVRIESPGSEFPLPEAKVTGPPPLIDNRDVLSVRAGGVDTPLPTIDPGEEFRTVRIPVGDLPAGMEAIVAENENTYRDIEIRNVRFYDPSRQGDLEPSSPADTAGDAVIEFRGIEARRPTNDIDDLVDGLTIQLKRPSTEAVDLSVNPDVEAAKEGVIKYIFHYNQLLTRILILTSDDPAVIDELEYLEDEQRAEAEEQLGSMRGDLSLIQIKNRLQSLTTSPYPTRDGDELRILAHIGISTNAAGGGFGGALDFTKLRGYLEIDEDLLDEALNTRIEAVKDLFGRDTDGDLIVDSGVAWSTSEYVTPYTRTGGFMASKMARIDGQIREVRDDITDYEEHLEDYESELRREYGTMEGMLNQLERSSQDLDNFSRAQSGNR